MPLVGAGQVSWPACLLLTSQPLAELAAPVSPLPCAVLRCPPAHRWAWGRMATTTEGWAPYPPALFQMWSRTQALTMGFDGQGIANMLWWVLCDAVR